MNTDILNQLAEGKTPSYVFEVDELIEWVKKIKNTLITNNSRIEICYAIKANPFLLNILDNYVDKFEICSPGELYICKEADIDMKKIVLSGVNKENFYIEDALKYGVEIFTVESMDQLEKIQNNANATGKIVDVLLRLTSGNQFGMELECVKEIIKKEKQYPNISIRGIQYYSGTQKKIQVIKKDLRDLVILMDKLKLKEKNLEYGPGLPVNYYETEDEKEDFLKEFAESLEYLEEKVHITLELGRVIAAYCGKYITKVVDVKVNNECKYCIVDGGINHVNYYGQVMGMKSLPIIHYSEQPYSYVKNSIKGEEDMENHIQICGSLCTSADVLQKKFYANEVKIGDLFVFERIGAYSITEGGYLFLSRKLPKVYLLKNNKLKLLRNSYETYKWNLPV